MGTLVTGAAGFSGSTFVDHRNRQSQRGPSVANLAGLRRDGTASRSTGYDVLVLDGSFKQSLASVRSLGRAGLRVAAGESVGQSNVSERPVPAFRSRYCQGRLILPDLVADTAGFI